MISYLGDQPKYLRKEYIYSEIQIMIEVIHDLLLQ